MVTLDTIVRNVMSEMGMNTTHEYARYLNIANTGLKELTYDVLGKSKVILLLVDETLRADLPTDFVDYTFVGIVGDNGYVQPLGARGDIPKVGEANLLAQTERYASVYGPVFGAGGGQNLLGYYQPQIDEENWQMIFAAVAVNQIVYLEYISDGSVATTNETVVPEYAEEALMAYTYWRAIYRKRNIPSIEKQLARKEYYNQKRLAVARSASFTKEEALQRMRKGFKLAPKM